MKPRAYTQTERFIHAVLASDHADALKLALIKRYMTHLNVANTALDTMEELEKQYGL
jgi:hypothetical protein